MPRVKKTILRLFNLLTVRLSVNNKEALPIRANSFFFFRKTRYWMSPKMGKIQRPNKKAGCSNLNIKNIYGVLRNTVILSNLSVIKRKSAKPANQI